MGCRRPRRQRSGRKRKEPHPLDAVIDEMLGGSMAKEDGERVYNQLKKRIVERMISAELTHHLGDERGEDKPDGQPNHRASLEKTLGPCAAGAPISSQDPTYTLDDECDREPSHAVRKIIKTRGHFPTDEAAGKLIYPALRNIVKKWKDASPH